MPLLDDLSIQSEESIEKILSRLLQKDNIEMKTEIQQPLNLTRLKILGVWLKMEQMDSAAKLVDDFIDWYLLYMVSKDRKRAQEIIQAISESLKKEKPMSEKLTTPP